jgi:hypothetical protein
VLPGGGGLAGGGCESGVHDGAGESGGGKTLATSRSGGRGGQSGSIRLRSETGGVTVVLLRSLGFASPARKKETWSSSGLRCRLWAQPRTWALWTDSDGLRYR